jgi:hypothetical protein
VVFACNRRRSCLPARSPRNRPPLSLPSTATPPPSSPCRRQHLASVVEEEVPIHFTTGRNHVPSPPLNEKNSLQASFVDSFSPAQNETKKKESQLNRGRWLKGRMGSRRGAGNIQSHSAAFFFFWAAVDGKFFFLCVAPLAKRKQAPNFKRLSEGSVKPHHC